MGLDGAGTPGLTERWNRFLLKKPAIGAGVYIARTAVVLGDVTMEEGSSIW